MNTTTCPSCHASFAATAATFCPFCGVGTAPNATPFNKTLVANLLREPTGNETVAMEPVEDFRPGRRHGLKLFVGVAVTSAVVAGVITGSWLADIVHRPATFEPIPTVMVQAQTPAPTPVVPEVMVSPNPDGGFDITRGAEIIHTVRTSKGSRYNTLDERMRSVGVRFKHIATKAEGRFAARLAGDHYELVWADQSGDFRLMDITEQDVAGTEGNTDFTANYLADRLNADLGVANNS